MEETRGSERKASRYVNDGTLHRHQVGYSYVVEGLESIVRHEWVTGAAHGSSKIQKMAPSSRKRKAAPDKNINFSERTRTTIETS
jgi:hypothetical protein